MNKKQIIIGLCMSMILMTLLGTGIYFVSAQILIGTAEGYVLNISGVVETGADVIVNVSGCTGSGCGGTAGRACGSASGQPLPIRSAPPKREAR